MLRPPKTEQHPWAPFCPPGTQILMLGSFPPPAERWSMPFYYPNWQNDMWRIFGLIFFQNPGHFENRENKTFFEDKIKSFLTAKRIAVSDVARRVIRHQGNASDRYLEVVEPISLQKELRRLDQCRALVTTGKKSSDVLGSLITELISEPTSIPALGGCQTFSFENRFIQWFRMPSSSRAWPQPLSEKARIYQQMFESIAAQDHPGSSQHF